MPPIDIDPASDHDPAVYAEEEDRLARQTRCPSCRCHVDPDHQPGSEDCQAAREERRWSIADE